MPEFLTREEGAVHLTERGLKISKGTLQKMATVGGGPVYQIFGGRALYTRPNLDAWAEAKLSPPRKSTSDIAKDDEAAAQASDKEATEDEAAAQASDKEATEDEARRGEEGEEEEAEAEAPEAT